MKTLKRGFKDVCKLTICYLLSEIQCCQWHCYHCSVKKFFTENWTLFVLELNCWRIGQLFSKYWLIWKQTLCRDCLVLVMCDTLLPVVDVVCYSGRVVALLVSGVFFLDAPWRHSALCHVGRSFWSWKFSNKVVLLVCLW